MILAINGDDNDEDALALAVTVYLCYCHAVYSYSWLHQLCRCVYVCANVPSCV